VTSVCPVCLWAIRTWHCCFVKIVLNFRECYSSFLLTTLVKEYCFLHYMITYTIFHCSVSSVLISFYIPWTHRRLDHWSLYVWPVLCQTHSYLPICKASVPTDQYQIIHTYTQPLQLYGFCPGQPRWASTRRNIHPLTPIVSIVPYLLHPSITIHGILSVQSTCLSLFSAISLQVFSGLPLGLAPSTSYSIHFFTQSLSSFRNTCPYHRNLLLLDNGAQWCKEHSHAVIWSGTCDLLITGSVPNLLHQHATISPIPSTNYHIGQFPFVLV